MTWHAPVVLVVIFAYVVHPYVNKKIANDDKYKIAKIAIFPVFALVGSLLLFILGKFFGLIDGSIVINKDVLIFFLISLLNPLANYFHWQALKTHQSLTAVFTWLDDLVCLALGYFVLSEGKFLNIHIILGMVMIFMAVVIFSSFKGSIRGINAEQLRNLIISVAKYSVIWGAVMFLMRFFALRGMRWFEFVPTWYLGSSVGGLVLFLLSDKETRGSATDLRPYLPICFGMGISALVSMLLMYRVRSWPNLPILATQPIFQASEMILPTLVGLYVYHEKKNFNWLGWAAMAIGLVGGLIIAFSF